MQKKVWVPRVCVATAWGSTLGVYECSHPCFGRCYLCMIFMRKGLFNLCGRYHFESGWANPLQHGWGGGNSEFSGAKSAPNLTTIQGVAMSVACGLQSFLLGTQMVPDGPTCPVGVVVPQSKP